MAKTRGAVGSLGTALRVLLKVFNGLISLFGVGMIIMVFVLESPHTPNFVPGWLWIGLGIITIISAASGLASSYVLACYIIHLVFAVLAILGAVASTLACYVNPARIRNSTNFPETRFSPDAVLKFYKGLAWPFLILLFMEILEVILLILARRFLPDDTYYDLKGDNTTEKRMALSEMKAKAERQADKVEKTKTSALANKMKEKYGKWSHEDWGEASGV